MNIQEMIEVAKNSAQVLSQTLSFTDPTKEDISKNTLIQVRERERENVRQFVYISFRNSMQNVNTHKQRSRPN